MELLLKRLHDDGLQTNGMLGLWENGETLFACETLELPWLDNRWKISCIPPGTYSVKKRWSPKFKHHLHVMNVPGRTWILIHPGNTVNDITGCILVGEKTGDNLKNSRKTLDSILELIPDRIRLTVKECQPG